MEEVGAVGERGRKDWRGNGKVGGVPMSCRAVVV